MNMEVYELGNRKELFPDLEKLSYCEAKLTSHRPEDRGVCHRFDAPWEGWGCGYMFVVPDGNGYRMYYVAGGNKDTTGRQLNSGHKQRPTACVLFSRDGINWERPELGLFEYGGSKANNIVYDKYTALGYTSPEAFAASHDYLDNFSVFYDRGDCPEDERWKATDGAWKNLRLYGSPDGLHWHQLNGGKPADLTGTFDSGNVPLRDENGTYHFYYRSFHGPDGKDYEGTDYNSAIRDIRHAVSSDFIHWKTLGRLDFGDAPDLPLYTSTIMPCPGTKNLLIGFPVRYIERAQWSPSHDQLPNRDHRLARMEQSRRHGLALTDCLIMFSRDGQHFTRSRTAYMTPGISAARNWVYGDCYFSIGTTLTPPLRDGAPAELSMYMMDNHFQCEKELRRYAIRRDGFMSLSFGPSPQTAVTVPLTFSGSRLTLNVASSAATDGRVALCEPDGREIDGYGADDCDGIFGDRPDYTVSWRGGRDVSRFAGKPLLLKFVFNDAELYGYKFD